MSDQPIKVLLIEDNPGDARLLQVMLEEAESASYDLVWVGRLAAGLDKLATDRIDIVLSDLTVPDSHGFETFARVHAQAPHVPIIVLSGLNDEALAVRAVREGAQDYLVKGQVDSNLLTRAIRYAIERKRVEEVLAAERASLAQRVAERTAELSEANAELIRAARLKDEFLANMSHELRTPLGTIMGMRETLDEGIYGPLNEEQRSALNRIDGSARHLLSLINDILDVAKIEAGEFELGLSAVSVEAVCRASLSFIQQRAHKKRLSVIFSRDSAVTSIQADERRLKQILINLLNNAVKFTPQGGQIGLEVTGDIKNGQLLLAVWDTGIGIAESDIGRLFSPFVQLDSSLSRQYEGTGLGLSLARRLVDLHGGRVSVETEIGKGSRFTVSLPWKATEPDGAGTGGDRTRAQEATDTATVTLPHDAPLLLLAEDNEYIIDALTRYLEAKGYRVVVARDGAEAVAQAQAAKPKLILMDVQMPGMDGLEASTRIRADPGLAHVPIIALTGLAMPGDDERCLRAGVNAYVSKPASFKKLVAEIESQLSLANARLE